MLNLKPKKAMALIMAYSVVSGIFILTVGILNRAIVEINLAKRERLTAQAFYSAEAGLTDGVRALIQRTANNEKESDIAHIQSAWYPAVMEGFQTQYKWDDLEGADTTKTHPKSMPVSKRLYLVSATAKHTTYDVTKTVNYLISRNKTYAFQYAVFYADNLEITPGPRMTLSGAIHSNKDIYLHSSNPLEINTDYLYSAGKIFNKRSDNGSWGGNVKIKENGKNNLLPMYDTGNPYYDSTPLDSNRPDWFTESQNRWGGTVKSDIHGITSLAAPQVGSIDTDGYYATTAGVTIDNCVIKQNGTELVEGDHIPNGTCTTTTSFYNNREKKYVKMSVIDVDKLSGGTYNGKDYDNNMPVNGLLYADRSDTGGSESPGVELINGSIIKPTSGATRDGLTVVSRVPVYVKGNYNKGDGGSNPKQPASIICDSINILSNDWDDNNSDHTVSNRKANPTTVNSAFIAGIEDTVPNYRGGLQNYPRLHEDWDNVDLNISGSFVQLWQSVVAAGQWCYPPSAGCQQYWAPDRSWDYDSDFDDTGKLPPYTPFVVQAERIAWWES